MTSRASFLTAFAVTSLIAASVSTSANAADGAIPPLASGESTLGSAAPLMPSLSLEAPPAGAIEEVPYSVPMRTTGQVLTAVGGAHMAAGAIAIGVFSRPDQLGVFGTLFIGLPVLGTGVVLTAVGIPLWAVGDHDVPAADRAKAEAYAPRLQLGVGSVMVTGAF